MTARQHNNLVRREQRVAKFFHGIDCAHCVLTRVCAAALAWAIVVAPDAALDFAMDVWFMGFVA